MTYLAQCIDCKPPRLRYFSSKPRLVLWLRWHDLIHRHEVRTSASFPHEGRS